MLNNDRASGLLLLVQADSTDCKHFAGQFRALGFTVFAVFDGSEALSLLFANRPRVMVLDPVLPGLDGIELCRKAREIHGNRIAILFLTALIDVDLMEVCFEAGANDFLNTSAESAEIMGRVMHWVRPESLRTQGKDRKRRLATLRTAAKVPRSAIENSGGLSSETDPEVKAMSEFIGKARKAASASFGRTREEKLYLLGYVSGVVNYWGTVKDHMQAHRAHYLWAVLRETGILSNDEIKLMLVSLDELSESATFAEATDRGLTDAVTGMAVGRTAVPMSLARFGQLQDA